MVGAALLTTAVFSTLVAGAAVVAPIAGAAAIPIDAVQSTRVLLATGQPGGPDVIETTVLDTTVPETTVPETTVPGGSGPSSTVPGGSGPSSTIPESGGPTTTVPDTTVPAPTTASPTTASPTTASPTTVVATGVVDATTIPRGAATGASPSRRETTSTSAVTSPPTADAADPDTAGLAGSGSPGRSANSRALNASADDLASILQLPIGLSVASKVQGDSEDASAGGPARAIPTPAPLTASVLASAILDMVRAPTVPRRALGWGTIWTSLLAWLLLWRRRRRPVYRIVGVERGATHAVRTSDRHAQPFALAWCASELLATGRTRSGPTPSVEIETPAGPAFVSANHLEAMPLADEL